MAIVPEPLPTADACHEDGSIILAGTGHRPEKLGGYGWAARQRVTAFAVKQLARHKPDLVITGMALGWDQALAIAARDLSIPYWAAIPFRGQEAAWPQSAQDLHAELLRDAAGKTIVSEGAWSAEKMQIRNVWMADRGHQVLALWNGTSGGTRNCVDYTMRRGKPVINCWVDWEQF